ncbi:unnamed protein product, partial [Adineta ricciae]
MSASDDESPPKQLLEPLTRFIPPPTSSSLISMVTTIPATTKKPSQITFTSRDEEIEYTRKLLQYCSVFNAYPETDHPFIIRDLLIDDALDYYLAHEDLIYNFYGLRKLFLRKHNLLDSLRTVSTLDSVGSLTLNDIPSALASTQLASEPAAAAPTSQTTFSLNQSIDDLTQNDIRKTIIEDLQRNRDRR